MKNKDKRKKGTDKKFIIEYLKNENHKKLSEKDIEELLKKNVET